ncbi:MAG TPA: thiamine diphosphokinase [Williamwhitmania sp.]|nr:thiamine diphosphokinase [Williamwhitmania sp.]
MVNDFDAVILANGKYPEREEPVSILSSAKFLICCDGAAVKHVGRGNTPDAVVGDLDSLPGELKLAFAEKLYHDPDQNTNDLTKSIRFCQANGFRRIAILGSTGLREDHTLGNISLMVNYAQTDLDVTIITDTGIFIPVLASRSFASFAGQQISLFSFNSETTITTEGLKYPIVGQKLSMWWQGTLNEALGESFRIDFSPGPLAVYFLFRDCR